MINQITLDLDKNKKHLIACSFGPDSMALLHAAITQGFNIVVAHVNYHKRDVSNFEQKSLENYCKKYNLKFEVFDTKNLTHSGNFQNWAREVRYSFFKDVCLKHGCSDVVVAHQEDDLLETYIMQKKRGNYVKYWGISPKNELFGITVLRPLLSYSKRQLLEYDLANNVPYSIDESNLTDLYTRNKIRHHEIENLKFEERKALISELKNRQKFSESFSSIFDLKTFVNFEYEKVVEICSYFMEKINEHRDLSKPFVSEIKKALTSKPNIEIKLTESLSVFGSYGFVYFVDIRKLVCYEHEFSYKFSDDLFEINFEHGATDRGINAADYPLTIKNLTGKEDYDIKGNQVKVRRLFIDWKVPQYIRYIWPGVFNKDGKLIYIPRYRREFEDNHTSIFKIKLENLSKF